MQKIKKIDTVLDGLRIKQTELKQEINQDKHHYMKIKEKLAAHKKSKELQDKNTKRIEKCEWERII